MPANVTPRLLFFQMAVPNSLLNRENFPVLREFQRYGNFPVSGARERGCGAAYSRRRIIAGQIASLPRPACGERAGVRGRTREAEDMGQVDGKIALVTGGASGIGEACVETLAREGAAVVISDIDDVRGNDLASSVNAAGRQAIYLRHDVTDETQWQQAVAETERRP